MSKSITGSGSLNLTLNELRLLQITTTSIESTNATVTNQLTGNNANFSGVLSVGSLTITGSFTVVDFVSTGTITGNDLTITGTMTYKGQDIDVRFVSLAQLNAALASYVLTSTLNTTLSNYVLTSALNTALSDYVLTTALNTTLSDYVLTTALNTALSHYVLTTALNTALALYVDKASAQTIAGVKTFSNNIILESLPTDNTDDNNRYIPFQGVNNILHSDSKLLFNPVGNMLTAGKITAEETITSAHITATTEIETPLITMTTGTIFNHVSESPPTNVYMGFRGSNTGVAFNMAFWNDGHVRFNSLGIGYRFYHTSNEVMQLTANTLDCKNNLLVRGTIRIETATTASADTYYSVLIRDADGEIITDTELVFNTFQNILKTRSFTVENRIRFSDENGTNTATDDTEYGVMSRDPNTQMRYSTNASINGDYDGNDNARLTINKVDATIVDADTLNCGTIKDATSVDFSIGSSTVLSIDASDTTIINDLICLSVDNSTTNSDLPLLLRESSGLISKSNTANLSYNANSDTLKIGQVYVDNPLIFQGTSVIPLNYTITIGHTNSIKTIDAVGSGLNTNKWGGGTILSILRSGVKATSYGSNSDFIVWNAYNDSSNIPTSFTIGYSGLWRIKIMVTYNNQSSSYRVVPILKLLLNGATTIEEGTEMNYIRYSQGRIGTVTWEDTIHLTALNTLQFQTYINVGSTASFTSSVSSSNFAMTDFMFTATFLGPLTQYDRTP